MGKWSQRHDNRRRLSQAANQIDNAIEHLYIIHESYPDGYEQHKEFLTMMGAALGTLKREIESYRSKI